jgi:hypothetical protein
VEAVGGGWWRPAPLMAAALGGEQWWGGFGGRGRGEAARVGGGTFMA